MSPFRNAHFLSVAVSWAEAVGAGAIYIGAGGGRTVPDIRIAGRNITRVFQELIPRGQRGRKTQIEVVNAGDHAEEKAKSSGEGLELSAPLQAHLVLLSE